MPVAEEMLRQHGEFYPYGGYMKADETIVHVGATDPDTDHPKAKDLVYLLWESLRAKARENDLVVVAVVLNVAVDLPGGSRSDAIQVCVEHIADYVVEIFFPYSVVDGVAISGETFAQIGTRRVFRGK